MTTVPDRFALEERAALLEGLARRLAVEAELLPGVLADIRAALDSEEVVVGPLADRLREEGTGCFEHLVRCRDQIVDEVVPGLVAEARSLREQAEAAPVPPLA